MSSMVMDLRKHIPGKRAAHKAMPKRVCSRCRHHLNKEVPLKDHKQICPYKDCNCDDWCKFIAQRRELDQQAKRLTKNREHLNARGSASEIPGEVYSSPSSTPSSMTPQLSTLPHSNTIHITPASTTVYDPMGRMSGGMMQEDEPLQLATGSSTYHTRSATSIQSNSMLLDPITLPTTTNTEGADQDVLYPQQTTQLQSESMQAPRLTYHPLAPVTQAQVDPVDFAIRGGAGGSTIDDRTMPPATGHTIHYSPGQQHRDDTPMGYQLHTPQHTQDHQQQIPRDYTLFSKSQSLPNNSSLPRQDLTVDEQAIASLPALQPAPQAALQQHHMQPPQLHTRQFHPSHVIRGDVSVLTPTYPTPPASLSPPPSVVSEGTVSPLMQTSSPLVAHRPPTNHHHTTTAPTLPPHHLHAQHHANDLTIFNLDNAGQTQVVDPHAQQLPISRGTSLPPYTQSSCSPPHGGASHTPPAPPTSSSAGARSSQASASAVARSSVPVFYLVPHDVICSNCRHHSMPMMALKENMRQRSTPSSRSPAVERTSPEAELRQPSVNISHVPDVASHAPAAGLVQQGSSGAPHAVATNLVRRDSSSGAMRVDDSKTLADEQLIQHSINKPDVMNSSRANQGFLNDLSSPLSRTAPHPDLLDQTTNATITAQQQLQKHHHHQQQQQPTSGMLYSPLQLTTTVHEHQLSAVSRASLHSPNQAQQTTHQPQQRSPEVQTTIASLERMADSLAPHQNDVSGNSKLESLLSASKQEPGSPKRATPYTRT